MKPRSATESYWRTTGREARKHWKQGPGAARTARQFTRMKAHRAMRAQGQHEVRQGLREVWPGGAA